VTVTEPAKKPLPAAADPHDPDAWVGEAYAAHAGELYGFARHALRDDAGAEEAVQETFVRAWRFRSRFDPEVGGARAWLFGIARNVIADIGRARARQPVPTDEDPGGTDDSLDDLLLVWQVEEGLRRIGDAHRHALVETQLRGRTHAELAAEWGIPEGTVKSRVYYGLRALRNALEEMGYEGPAAEAGGQS
jgi:RNA polymerase sigma-70 factor (ECF subfamily)